MNKTFDMIKGEYKIMDQKVLAVVGGHEITDKEVDAFIKSLPREQRHMHLIRSSVHSARSSWKHFIHLQNTEKI